VPREHTRGCIHLRLGDTLVFVLRCGEADRLQQHRQLPSTGLQGRRGQISALILASENIPVKMLNSQATTQLQQLPNRCTVTRPPEPPAQVTYKLAF